MKFTKEIPTKPGYYLWRENADDTCPEVCSIRNDQDGDLIGYFETGLGVLMERMGGEWCRLVPAEEIEKAWIESYDDVIGIKGTALPIDRWNNSRAKRVMEGGE